MFDVCYLAAFGGIKALCRSADVAQNVSRYSVSGVCRIGECFSPRPDQWAMYPGTFLNRVTIATGNPLQRALRLNTTFYVIKNVQDYSSYATKKSVEDGCLPLIKRPSSASAFAETRRSRSILSDCYVSRPPFFKTSHRILNTFRNQNKTR